jgi:hypothetical protein
MKILIQDFDEWPAVAEPAVWRGLLDCTHLTLQRVEHSGALIHSGITNHKVYTRASILKWLNIPEN